MVFLCWKSSGINLAIVWIIQEEKEADQQSDHQDEESPAAAYNPAHQSSLDADRTGGSVRM